MLFDVADVDALGKMKIPEDSLFLGDQRSVRRMITDAEDKKFTAKQKRIKQRRMKEEKQKQKAGETSTSQTVYYRPENSTSESNDEASDDYRPSTSISEPENLTVEKIKIKLQLRNADVASAPDRNKTSDREAVRLMIPMAAALDHDPAKLPLSQSTIQRAQKRTRRDVSDSVGSDFELSYPLVVHWHGKALSEMLGGRDVERLPVLVSGDGNEKLLGVPKINAGTGENEVNAFYGLLQERKLTEKVQAMSFYIISVNTGRHTRVCKRLEDKLGHEFLWLGCRHHIQSLFWLSLLSLLWTK